MMEYLKSTAAWRTSSRIFVAAVKRIGSLKAKLHSRFRSAGVIRSN
jgi:hypothetical protein